jgi:dienelactone hydrolase
MPACTRRAATAVFLLASFPLLAPAAPPASPADEHAAVVYFKDGFAVKGYVKQDNKLFFDRFSGAPVAIPKGYYYIQDPARAFHFSHHQIQETVKKPFDPGEGIRTPARKNAFYTPKAPPAVREILDVSDWDDSWDRTYKYRGPDGWVRLTQNLFLLSPRFAWIDATPKNNNPIQWRSAYLTPELGREAVLALLAAHPALKDGPDLKEEPRADRRLRVFNFVLQAGWIDDAEKELERLRKDFPKQEQKIKEATEDFKRARAAWLWDEVRVAQAAGRHRAAMALLAKFPEDGADPRLLSEVHALRDRYEAADAALKRAGELLRTLPEQVPVSADRQMFAAAAAAIVAELNADHFLKQAGDAPGQRFELFLSQAERAERQQKDGKPSAKPAELLALAVSGWLLGGASAETNPETARRLWRARQMVLAYQKTPTYSGREKLLAEYRRQSAVTVEEVAQLIDRLPPPEPPEDVSTTPVKRLAEGWFGRGRTTYHLQLPPEYHAGRAYPVLIALHHAAEDGRDMLKRWGEAAARHGYILAAPDWGDGIGGAYGYTSAEHAAVLDTLRDLRRRFAVDNDRVFLTGFGEGGNMAQDVGLAHPDLFAGVLPFAGQPRYHVTRYWPNAQFLPMYIVWGEKMGPPDEVVDPRERERHDGNKLNYSLFQEWIPGGYPALGVEYKGRGVEWFAGEVPNAFAWMGRQRRANPQAALGGDGREFRTMRAADNRFYWLSTEQILAGCLNDGPKAPGNWDWRRTPALLGARISAGNQIGIQTKGVKQVSLWLARGMIDFDKPVTVRLNLGIVGAWNNQKVAPRLETLLEDFCQRGDRQRLYVARLDLRP